jgi:hypothetical protein
MTQLRWMTALGWTLSSLFALFLFFSGAIKLMGRPEVAATMTALEWQTEQARAIGLIEIGCTLLYLIPRTALLGAALMMGVLGGAIATHWRIESPLFSHTLFSIYLGVFLWGGLILRDPRVRALFPLRR